MHNVQSPEGSLIQLRAIRVYHWKEVVVARGIANAHREQGNAATWAAQMDEVANVHLKFVQTLNDFFPVDDTAEQDCAGL